MTINEQIAKVMGWKYNKRIDKFQLRFRGDYYKLHELAKLLQAKMVGDGWKIIINASPNGYFEAWATILHGDNICSPAFDTEPAAIVELFCKVYGIKEAK